MLRHSLWLLACATLFSACAHNPPNGELETWNANHPQAAQGLCVWVQGHQKASHLFFEWDANHPDRSQAFVQWTLAHPNQGIDAFVAEHPGWPGFDRITENHRPAAQSFMEWIRQYPEAAQRLMTHSGGLAWAGNHLGC